MKLRARPGADGNPELILQQLTGATPRAGSFANGAGLELAWSTRAIVAADRRDGASFELDETRAAQIQVSRVRRGREVVVILRSDGRKLSLKAQPPRPWLLQGLPEIVAENAHAVPWATLATITSVAWHIGARVAHTRRGALDPLRVPTPSIVHQGASWTLVDAVGRGVLVPNDRVPEVDFIGAFSEGLAPFRVAERWGFLDRFGEVAIAPTYHEVQPFSSGFAAYSSNGWWGFVDRGGSYRMGPTARGAGSFSEGLAAVATDESWGYVRADCSWAIEPRFTAAGPFRDGVAACAVDGRFGLLDRAGAWRLPPTYDHVLPASDGLVAFRRGGLWGFATITGHEVIEACFEEPGSFAAGVGTLRSGARVSAGGSLIEARIVTPASSGLRVERTDGAARFVPTVSSDADSIGVCTHSYAEARPFAGGLAAARRPGGRWGFVDREGVWLADVSVERSRDFHGGLAAVYDDERWSFVAADGERVGESFREVSDFSEGFAAVRDASGWQLMDTAGRRIGPVVTAMKSMREGWAPARATNGKWGALDITGAWAIAPSLDTLGTLSDGIAKGRIGHHQSTLVVPSWWLAWSATFG